MHNKPDQMRRLSTSSSSGLFCLQRSSQRPLPSSRTGPTACSCWPTAPPRISARISRDRGNWYRAVLIVRWVQVGWEYSSGTLSPRPSPPEALTCSAATALAEGECTRHLRRLSSADPARLVGAATRPGRYRRRPGLRPKPCQLWEAWKLRP